MADEKTVEREMLTNSYVNGAVVKRGDVVQLTEAQAKAWEDLDRPACAEVGYLDKLAEEHAKANEIRAEAEQRAHEAVQEAARVRRQHDLDRSADTSDDDKSDSGSNDDGDDDKSTRTATSSQSGPKVTRSSTARR